MAGLLEEVMASEQAQAESIHQYEQPPIEKDFGDFSTAAQTLVFQDTDGSQVSSEDRVYGAPQHQSKEGVDDSGIYLDPAFGAPAFSPQELPIQAGEVVDSLDYDFPDIDTWLLNQPVEEASNPQKVKEQKRAETVSPVVEGPAFAVTIPPAIPTPLPTGALPVWAHAWKGREIRNEQGRLLAQYCVPAGHCQALVILAPGIVFEWWQAGMALDDISRLQQYYITVVQMYTMATLKEVMALRSTAPYHELDHRNTFSGTRGIPLDGWLPPNLAYRYQLVQRHQATYTKNKFHELVEYPSFNEPIPTGSTNAIILQHFPNHVKHEFLDSFIQNGITYGQIFRCIEPRVFQLLKTDGVIGVVSEKTAENNVFNKRIQKRRSILVKEAYPGRGKLSEFLSTPIRIRQTGNLTYYRPHGQKVISAQEYAVPERVPAMDSALPSLTQQMPVAAAQPLILALMSEAGGRDDQDGSQREHPIHLTGDHTPSDESLDTPEAPQGGAPVRIATGGSASPVYDSSEAYIRSKDWQIADDVLDPLFFAHGAEQQENNDLRFLDHARALSVSLEVAGGPAPFPVYGSTLVHDYQDMPALADAGQPSQDADALQSFTPTSFDPLMDVFNEASLLDLGAADRAAMQAIPPSAGTIEPRTTQSRKPAGKKPPQQHLLPSSPKAGKRPRRELDDIEGYIPQFTEPGPKKAKKSAGTDTSLTSALMLNPPSAQNANKRRRNSLNDDVEERIEPKGKKPRHMTSPTHIPTQDQSVPVMQVPDTSSSTHGTLNDFGSRYSTAGDDFSRQTNGAHLQYDPRATVDPQALRRTDPQTQMETQQRYRAATKLRLQSDMSLSLSRYQDSSRQQNTTDCTIPVTDATSNHDQPVADNTQSPFLSAEYDFAADHEQHFLNPPEQVEPAQVAGGHSYSEEELDDIVEQQLLAFNNSM